MSDADIVERFQNVFSRAVRSRTAGTDGTALMLSGGLDSTSILAMMRRQAGNGQVIDTYSIVAGEARQEPESRAIDALAALPGIRPHAYQVPDFGEVLNRSDLTHIAWDHAHPADNSILLPNLLFLAAARNGHRTMLHGANGDVTQYSPQYYMADHIARLHWLDAWRECRMASARHVSLLGRSPVSIFLRAARQAVPEGLKRQVSRFRAQHGPPLSAESLLDPQFAQNVADLQDDGGTSAGTDVSADETSEMIAIGLAGFYRCAARFGVEASDPWGDRDLVAFFLGLPRTVLAKEGCAKYVARRAFAGDLPFEVIRRSDKQHFGGRLVELLLNDSREFLAAVLDEDIGLVEPFLDLAQVRALRSLYLDTGDADLAHTLLRLTSLILWIKRVNSYASTRAIEICSRSSGL